MSVLKQTISPTATEFTLDRVTGLKVHRLWHPSYCTLISPLSVTLWTFPIFPMYYKKTGIMDAWNVLLWRTSAILGFQPPCPCCKVFSWSSETTTLTLSPTLNGGGPDLAGRATACSMLWPAHHFYLCTNFTCQWFLVLVLQLLIFRSVSCIENRRHGS